MMPRARVKTLIGIALGVWGLSGSAWAHPLDPALLELRESPGAPVEAMLREPLPAPGLPELSPVLPSRCVPLSTPSVEWSERGVTRRWTLDCGPQGLGGEQIRIQGLRERKSDALVRILRTDGSVVQAVLRADRSSLTVPERASAWSTLKEYLVLGVEHILGGFDHLLFVLGLLLLVRGRRLLLWTLSAFTVGHSLTLSLAVLGIIHLPPAPVEALIAFSIFVLAVELTRGTGDGATWARRRPWAMAVAFGLLHGLGFAGALAQIGLPAGDIPLALLSFNLGIELGQLLFIGLALPVVVVFARLPERWRKLGGFLPPYVIGSVSALLIFERIAAVLQSAVS